MQKENKKSSRKETKGVGDIVSNITAAFGVTPCNDCQQRKEWLNVNFPFNRPTPLTTEQIARIDTEPLQVYNEAFGTDIDEVHFKDGVKNSIIKKLTKLRQYEI